MKPMMNFMNTSGVNPHVKYMDNIGPLKTVLVFVIPILVNITLMIGVTAVMKEFLLIMMELVNVQNTTNISIKT